MTDRNSAPGAVDAFTEEFIQAIREKGIAHTLYWIQGWMDKYVEAQFEGEISEMCAGFNGKDTAQARKLISRTVYLGALRADVESINNHSTQIGPNYLRQAKVAVAARALRASGEDVLNTLLHDTYAQYQRLKPAQPKAEA